jgi:hypothetical protein
MNLNRRATLAGLLAVVAPASAATAAVALAPEATLRTRFAEARRQQAAAAKAVTDLTGRTKTAFAKMRPPALFFRAGDNDKRIPGAYDLWRAGGGHYLPASIAHMRRALALGIAGVNAERYAEIVATENDFEANCAASGLREAEDAAIDAEIAAKERVRQLVEEAIEAFLGERLSIEVA